MSNIFVSYSKEDSNLANNIRLILKSEGYTVWWDDDLNSGDPWEEEIHNALKRSSLILVIWTNKSKNSDWVKHEASIAKLKDNLIQIRIGDISVIPSIFQTVQATNLSDWNMRESHPDFRELTISIARKLKSIKRKKHITFIKFIIITIILSTLFYSIVNPIKIKKYFKQIFYSKKSLSFKNDISSVQKTSKRKYHYITYKNGTALDTNSGLLWMRCSVGQSWTGKSCEGNASTFTWSQAMKQTTDFAKYSDWRLPTNKELRSLVFCDKQPKKFSRGINSGIFDTNDWGCIGEPSKDHNTPTIVEVVFPNCPKFAHWTTSNYWNDPKKAEHKEVVNFKSGGVTAWSSDSSANVRLVRVMFQAPGTD